MSSAGAAGTSRPAAECAHAAAVDHGAERDGLAVAAGGERVALADPHPLGGDDNGVIALGGGIACQHGAAFVAETDRAARPLRGEEEQDAALRGAGAEVLGHAGGPRRDDGAAGDDGGAAVVDGAVAVARRPAHGEDAAGDEKRAVGIEPVAARVDVDHAAGNAQGGVRIHGEGILAEGGEAVRAVAAAGCVEAVVARGDVDHAAGNADDLRLQTLIALQHGEPAAGDAQRGVGVDAVVPAGEDELAAGDRDGVRRVKAVFRGADGDAAAADLDVPVLRIFIVRGDKAAGAGFDGQDTALDRDAVPAHDALFRCADGHCAVLDFEVVLCDDAVPALTGDAHGAVAVQVQVASGKDRGVRIVFIGESADGGEAVDAARRGGEDELVGASRQNGGGAGFRDLRAVEDQLDLRAAGGVHHDLPVGERAAQTVSARGADSDRAAADADGGGAAA